MCYLKGDFTIIRAHQHAAGAKKRGEDQALGPSRGGLSTKIHMAVRGPGCRVRFTPTAGQKGDAPQGDALIEGLPAEVVMAYTALSSAQRHRRQARYGGDSQQPVPCANVPAAQAFLRPKASGRSCRRPDAFRWRQKTEVVEINSVFNLEGYRAEHIGLDLRLY